MVRKEDVDFYCGFSRKELQSLCKKYNLPANRSSSDMAESLASYFEVVFFFGFRKLSMAQEEKNLLLEDNLKSLICNFMPCCSINLISSHVLLFLLMIFFVWNLIMCCCIYLTIAEK